MLKFLTLHYLAKKLTLCWQPNSYSFVIIADNKIFLITFKLISFDQMIEEVVDLIKDEI